MLGTKISQVQSAGLPSIFLRAQPCVDICTRQKNSSLSPNILYDDSVQ